MGFFDRTPLQRIANDLKYYIDCSVLKKDRKQRLKSIGHCHFWFINEYMNSRYKELRKDCPIIPAKIIYADYIYKDFENKFGYGEHEEWCIYDTKQALLREGIQKLGKTLHAMCHTPFELIEYRTVGLYISNENTKWGEIPDDKKCEYLKQNDEIYKLFKFILRREQFKKHCFEVMTLRDILSEEITLYENRKSTVNGWMWFVGGLLVAIISILIQLNYQEQVVADLKLIFNVLGTILPIAMLLTFIWHIWVSIRLNEAKDVMYICLGVDVDDPKTQCVCE